MHRMYRSTVMWGLLCILACAASAAPAGSKHPLFQTPALSRELIAFGYAGDLWTVPRTGGQAVKLPLPTAYQGQMSPDASHIAYSPLPPVFGFDYTSFVSWGSYRGGAATTIWVTSLPGLDSVQIPHELASDFSPVYSGGHIYFLSGRGGAIGIFRYDPGTRQVSEAVHNDGPDMRSLEIICMLCFSTRSIAESPRKSPMRWRIPGSPPSIATVNIFISPPARIPAPPPMAST